MGDSFLEDEAKNGEMRGEQGAIVEQLWLAVE